MSGRAAERRHRRAEADRRERAAAEYLTTLAADRQGAWPCVAASIAARKQRECDRDVALLRDLRELSQRDGTTDRFTDRIIHIRDQHARKPSLIARLDRARLGIPGTVKLTALSHIRW